MKVAGLMDKVECGQYLLLSSLLEAEGPMSLKSLSQRTGLSKATLLKYGDLLREACEEQGLDVTLDGSEDCLDLRLGADFSWQKVLQLLLRSASKYQILFHLFEREHFNIQALADQLRVSEATLNRHLAGLNQILAEFDLSISSGRLRGSEQQICYFYYLLFWQTWTKEDFEARLQGKSLRQQVRLVEQLCPTEFTKTQTQQLALWFYVVASRRAGERDFSGLAQLMLPFEKNPFFQRLEPSLERYFEEHALAYQKGEAYMLFAFLSAMSILPVATMEFILGFGGPIMERTGQALRLLKDLNLFAGQVHEQMTYILSQSYGRLYFFKGAILKWEHAPTSLTLSDLEHALLAIGGGAEGDLGQKVLEDWNQLLTFVADKVSRQVHVGVDMVESAIQTDLVVARLSHYLDNNRLISFETYQEGGDYDCILTNSEVTSYPDLPLYRLKGPLAARDLSQIALFLKKFL